MKIKTKYYLEVYNVENKLVDMRISQKDFYNIYKDLMQKVKKTENIDLMEDDTISKVTLLIHKIIDHEMYTSERYCFNNGMCDIDLYIHKAKKGYQFTK